MKQRGKESRIVQRKKSNCESDLTKLQPALWGALEWVFFFWVFCLAGLLYANLPYCMQAVAGRAWPQMQWLHSCSRPWRSWQMEAPVCRLCNWAAGPSFEEGIWVAHFHVSHGRWEVTESSAQVEELSLDGTWTVSKHGGYVYPH